MRHYSAKQRADDHKWVYTCGSRAVGYCADTFDKQWPEECPEYLKPYMSAEDYKTEREKHLPFQDKFHADGHATKQDACECYRQFLLDMHVRKVTSTGAMYECRVCKTFTPDYVLIGNTIFVVLCKDHQSREYYEMFRPPVNESWES